MIRFLEYFGVFFFVATGLFLFSNSLLAESFSLVGLAGGAFLGWMLSDMGTGTLHWLGDRFFHPTTPVLGVLFVFPFREHHIDPKKMTRHDFFELCGTSGILLGIIFMLSYLVRGSQGDLVSFSLFFFGLFAFLTNLFHKWAHEDNLSPVIQFLQKTGLILDPVHHSVHHKSYDTYYCVTHGHMNRFLHNIKFFPTMEKILFFLPRGVEDQGDVKAEAQAT